MQIIQQWLCLKVRAYSSIIEEFNPATTLFVGNGDVIQQQTERLIKLKIVVLEQTSSLPELPEIRLMKTIMVQYLDFIDNVNFNSNTVLLTQLEQVNQNHN